MNPVVSSLPPVLRVSLAFTLLVVPACGSTEPNPNNCVPRQKSLVAWWKAENDALDSVSTNHGTLANSPAFAPGKVGQAFAFDGVNQSVVVPDHPSLNPTLELTLECWFFAHAYPPSWGWDLLSKDGEYAGPRQYLLTIGPAPHYGLTPHVGVPGGFFNFVGNTSVTLSNWYHVAMTYDGAELKLYVNGQLDGSRWVSGPLITSTEPFRIGGGAPPGQAQYHFPGLIDEVSVYERALDSNEIAAIYQAGSAGKCVTNPPPPDPITVIAGPVTNQANGSVYYLLSPTTWTLSEATAISMGGHLVAINDAAEDAWVFSTFGSDGKALWIGLNDIETEGTFVWSSGEMASYRNWTPGAPNNDRGLEDYTYIVEWNPGYRMLPGRWNDMTDTGQNPISGLNVNHPLHGVVEIPGTPPPVSVNLLVNGTFELPAGILTFQTFGIGTDIPGWTIDSGSADIVGPYWQAIEGIQSLDLNGVSPGSIHQDVHTSAGQTYLLRLAYAGNPEWLPALKEASVNWNGQPVTNLSFDTTGRTFTDMGWAYAEFQVTATGATSRLAFNAISTAAYGGLTLDDVSLTPLGPSPNLLVNGSFEDPPGIPTYHTLGPGTGLPGWVIESGTVDHVGLDWVAADGLQCLDLNGSFELIGTIYQDVPTIPGQSYHVRFAYAGNFFCGPVVKTTQVTWDGSLLEEVSFDTTGHSETNLGWVYFDYLVVASNTTTRLRFQSTTSTFCGPALDDVSVTLVETPPAADFLVNVDFGAGPGPSAKTGPAAIGLTPSDFWNFYTRDDGANGWRTLGALPNLTAANGTATGAGLIVSNAPGAWSLNSIDPMYNTYIYPYPTSTGNAVLTLTNLPPGAYDVCVYGADGNYEVSIGSTSQGVRHTSDDNPVINPPVWQEGKQYARWTNALVGAGQPLVVTVRPGTGGYAIISGLQIKGATGGIEPPPACELPSDIVSWWKGEDDALDQLGAYDGETPFGMAYADGMVGRAFDFDGSLRRVSVPDSPAFKLTNAMTLEAWVYPRAYQGFITFRGDNRGGLDTWTLDAYEPGFVKFSIIDDTNGVERVQAPMALDQWQHVAATWDRASGDMRVYINGTLAAETNTAIIPIAELDAEGAVGIGNHGGTFHQFPFNGLIDELAIYSRALSTHEIAAIYQAGSVGKCPTNPPPVGSLLVNVDCGAGLGASAKTGPAAIGQTASDFWNFYTRDDGANGWRTLGALPNLTAANGTATEVGLIVSNAPGAWSLNSTDPMYNTYIYPYPTSTGNAVLTLTNLPPGAYDVYVYGADGNYEVSAGGTSQGIRQTVDDNPVINPPAWQEGKQYARWSSVLIGAGQPLVVTVRQGTGGYAIISGLQIRAATSAAGPPAAVIVASAPQLRALVPNGSDALRLEFSGVSGTAYVVEASTNLVDWAPIGPATEIADGEFMFEDAELTTQPCQFYRIVTP